MKNGSLIYLNRHFQKTTWMMGCEPQPQHPRSLLKVLIQINKVSWISSLSLVRLVGSEGIKRHRSENVEHRYQSLSDCIRSPPLLTPFKVELSSRLSDDMSVLSIEIEGVACTEHSVKVVEVLSRDEALVCKVIVLHVRKILVGDLWRESLKWRRI